jgi:hypothetical protein
MTNQTMQLWFKLTLQVHRSLVIQHQRRYGRLDDSVESIGERIAQFGMTQEKQYQRCI